MTNKEYIKRHRERNKERYQKIAFTVGRRWFRLFVEEYPADAFQESVRIGLQFHYLSKPAFLRAANKEWRIVCKNYGLWKSNGSSLRRREICIGRKK